VSRKHVFLSFGVQALLLFGGTSVVAVLALDTISSKLGLTISSEAKSHVIDILFSAFQDNELDPCMANKTLVDLARKGVNPLRTPDDVLEIQSMRQFREGYICEIKKKIALIDVEALFLCITNNHFSYEKGFPDIHTHPSKLGRRGTGSHFDRSAYTHHYAQGVYLGIRAANDFERKMVEEIQAIARKHYIDDINLYRKKGKPVPDSELLPRVHQAHYLQAVILLKDKFQTSPVMKASVEPEKKVAPAYIPGSMSWDKVNEDPEPQTDVKSEAGKGGPEPEKGTRPEKVPGANAAVIRTTEKPTISSRSQ